MGTYSHVAVGRPVLTAVMSAALVALSDGPRDIEGRMALPPTEDALAGMSRVERVFLASRDDGALVSRTQRPGKNKVPAPMPTPIKPPVGTGGHYAPTHVIVTGGGPMPDWTSDVVTAACTGNGVADDTSCLQAAANTARSQNKPLAIPYTSAFYKVSRPITIYTSIGGIGGMPTIKTTTTAGDGSGRILILASGMTGWIYNLHMVGTFNGSNENGGEWSHNLDIGSVNGVTIKGNLFENAMGDAIGTNISNYDGGGASQNVIVSNNTLKNPFRCGVALVKNQKNWVIMNNVIEKPVNYVSGIDFEPVAGTVTNFEVAYNKFVMNNRTPNPSRGADGKAVFGWQVPTSPNPGGNYYIHHNYGTFGTGFSGFGGGNWGYIYRSANGEGGRPKP